MSPPEREGVRPVLTGRRGPRMLFWPALLLVLLSGLLHVALSDRRSSSEGETARRAKPAAPKGEREDADTPRAEAETPETRRVVLSGVVLGAVSREPVPGSTVTVSGLAAGAAVSCRADGRWEATVQVLLNRPGPIDAVVTAGAPGWLPLRREVRMRRTTDPRVVPLLLIERPAARVRGRVVDYGGVPSPG